VRVRTIIAATLAALVSASVFAADLEKQKPAIQETLGQKQARLQWWREARFGVFIHWGPVALKGTEISWSRNGIGTDIYDNLYKQFNPVEFNADEWVAVAKAAGMKYMVFTISTTMVSASGSPRPLTTISVIAHLGVTSVLNSLLQPTKPG
jgi:hypothetical protein